MQYLDHIRITLLILFAGGGISVHSHSQVEAVVKGKVLNENGMPIKNASVKLGSRDARTNTSGIFVVKSTTFPAILTVNHTLYEEYKDMVALPERWQDTIHVSVVLYGKVKELEEVTVSAENIFWVYQHKQANILDFIVNPDGEILLCCSDKNKYFIRRLDGQGEKIQEIPIRNHPKNLYRDCMDAVHLVYSDSIYETAFVNNSLGIFQPQALSGIYNLLKSCVYIDQYSLIKRNYSNQNQHVKFLSIDIETKQPTLLYETEDSEYANQIIEHAMEFKLNENTLRSNQVLELKIARGKWDQNRFYDQAKKKPAYIPLFELNDSLIIFDHITNSAVVFTKSGMQIRSFPIYYHYFDGWKHELIQNAEKTKLYARYESKDGLTTLREINTTNGNTEQVILLEKHVFPEHIQVQGNFIYYIYKDYLDQSMHYLYKQRLE